ncbi:MAG: DUF3232 domain-containing protein [Candidatus Paceibacterota bacterium]
MEPFLRESWNRKSDAEVGILGKPTDSNDEGILSPEVEVEQYEQTAQVKMYQAIEKAASKDEIANKLFCDLKESIVRYYNSVLASEHAQKKESDMETSTYQEQINKAEDSRTRAHDTVIGNLNALSRRFGVLDIDNEWRRVVGLERKQVTKWVEKVAPYILLMEK